MSGSKPGFSFPGPVPKEALNYIKNKGWKVGFSHLDVYKEEHARYFTVAKAMQLDVLKSIRGEVEKALAEGRTFQQFKKDMTPTLQKLGWWGDSVMVDPKDGKPKSVRLGSPRRLKTIYDANLRTSRAAGQWKRAQRTKEALPYLRYGLGPSEKHRIEHVEWNGIILPVDHLWWDTHYPPKGWGCKCRVRQVSMYEMGKRGWTVSEPPPDEMREWVNKRTGEIDLVPKGVDPGWNYNPGKAGLSWDPPKQKRTLPGQKTWKDLGRPDLRSVPESKRTKAPGMLPAGKDMTEAVETTAKALGIREGQEYATIETFDKDMAIAHRGKIPHTVEKREEARERYANYVIPTLEDPYEIWLTEYVDGLRKQYIGVFAGDKDVLVVVRKMKDGTILWNFMHAGDKEMNKHRIGEMLFGK